MIRAVFDTSVLIRYLIRPSVAIRELIEVRWLGDEVQMVTAPELIAELEGVLARDSIRAFVQAAEGEVLLAAIARKADVLPPLGAIPSFTRDAKDDKFVACALVGRADLVVTVDEDLLSLGELEGVRMMTPLAVVAALQG